MNGTPIRDVLAANLQKLRESTTSLRSYPDIARAGGPGNGTLGRVALKEQSLTIDLLESLARVFGMEAWQLLVPTLQARANGTNHPTISGLPGWPFPKVQQDLYESLDPEDKLVLQGVVLHHIEQARKIRPPSKKKMGVIK